MLIQANISKVCSYKLTVAKDVDKRRLDLVCKLGHVVLQAALVVRLLAHLDQDVEVTVLLSQSCHPLVLTQLHCNATVRFDFSLTSFFPLMLNLSSCSATGSVLRRLNPLTQR